MRKTLSSSLLAAVSAAISTSANGLQTSMFRTLLPRNYLWGRPNRYFGLNSPKLLAKRKECEEHNDHLKRLKQLTPHRVSRKGRII